MKTSQSILLSKYLNQYQKNRSSRVFAPLAECYRKAGMIDEALSVLREGLKVHNDYTLAYAVLAQCYADQGKHINAYSVLKNLADDNTDNIKLQRTYGLVCHKLEKLEEALQAYKFVLFYSPGDMEVAQLLNDLERELNLRRKVATQSREALNTYADKELEEEIITSEINTNEDLGEWEMKKIAPDLEREELVSSEAINKIEKVEKKVKKAKMEEESPIMTHTMVDIYLAQKHYEKAKELLEKILELNPNDKKSLEKLSFINKNLKGGEEIDFQASKKSDSDKYKNIEEALIKFHEKIKKRSKEMLGSDL